MIVFICIGLGFMLIEVTLFQRMVLYLGALTISLLMLLSFVLVGMGSVTFYAREIFSSNISRRLRVICFSILFGGVLLFIAHPLVLDDLLESGNTTRELLSFLMIFPFGFLLGIPFPTAIQLLQKNNVEQYIPWMHGVNGSVSVFGSVSTIILSMQSGFAFTFVIGLFFYLVVVLSTMATPSQENRLS